MLTLLACAAPSHVDPKAVAATAPPTEQEAIARLMRISSHFERLPFVKGNNVMLLRDGPATYAAMTDAINAATRRIDMESYQFDTAAASKFASLLLRKSAQGVQVHLIYDSWGSMSENAGLFDQLRRGGVQVVAYNPLGANGKVDLDAQSARPSQAARRGWRGRHHRRRERHRGLSQPEGQRLGRSRQDGVA